MGLLPVPIKLRPSGPRCWQILLTCIISTAMLLTFSPFWSCFKEEGHRISGTVLFCRPYEGGGSMRLEVMQRNEKVTAGSFATRGGESGDGQVSVEQGVLPGDGQLSQQGRLDVGSKGGWGSAVLQDLQMKVDGEGGDHALVAGEGGNAKLGIEEIIERVGGLQGKEEGAMSQRGQEERPSTHKKLSSSNASWEDGVSETALGAEGMIVDNSVRANEGLGSAEAEGTAKGGRGIAWEGSFQDGSVSGVNEDGGVLEGAGNTIRPHPSCRPDELVYVYDLPSEFHMAVLTESCAGSHFWSQHPRNACVIYSPDSGGIGPPLVGAEKEYLERIGSPVDSWADTGQFALEVMFHQYMLDSYPCRTERGEDAAAFYVPFYPGMLHHNRTLHCRDQECPEVGPLAMTARLLGAHLTKKPYWRRHKGRDHITTMSHVNVDGLMDDTCCTNGLLKAKHTKHFVIMGIESSSLTPRERQVSIPYPTCFHPATPAELAAHQTLITTSNRSVLASFAGQLDRTGLFWGRNLRQSIAEQCRKHPGDCDLLECGMECPCTSVVRAQLRANFCLQPTGDSPTRRSLFDSLQAGCIPVLFHRASAYDEYTTFLPPDESSYSVFIPETDVTNGGVDIIEVLRSIPAEELERKRKVIASMLPSISYEDHGRARAAAAAAPSEAVHDKPLNPLGERSAYGVALAEALRRVASALSSRGG